MQKRYLLAGDHSNLYGTFLLTTIIIIAVSRHSYFKDGPEKNKITNSFEVDPLINVRGSTFSQNS